MRWPSYAWRKSEGHPWMRYRRIDSSSLQVSEMSPGSWLTAVGREVDPALSARTETILDRLPPEGG